MGPRGKELTPQLRSRLCELKSIGWSFGKIKARYPEIPLETIRSTIRREKKRVDNTSQPRTGRPRQLSEEQREHIYALRQANPKMKISELVAAVDGAVQKRTIQRLLHDMEVSKRKQQNRPEPNPDASQNTAPEVLMSLAGLVLVDNEFSLIILNHS